MNKKHIIMTIGIVGLLTAVLCAINPNDIGQKEPVVDEWYSPQLDEEEETFVENNEAEADVDDEYMSVTIDVPKALNSIVKGASWSAEHFCTTGDRVYYLAEDEHLFTTALFAGDKVFVEDPSFYYVGLDTTMQKFSISVGERSIVVDFTDPKSVNQLSKLNYGTLPGFERKRWGNKADFHDYVRCPLEIDRPTSSIANSQHISRWIANVALASVSGPTRVALSRPYFTTAMKNRSGYKGNISDWDAINKFISTKYFDGVIEEWGTDKGNYPPALYSGLSLRARYLTSRYITYQMVDYGYGGGAHGYSDVELISYDHENHQEIGWTYLFKPGCEEKVLNLFEQVAQTNEQYRHWDAYLWAGVRLTDKDGNQTGEMLLPRPALTPAGVTISFPPYVIACHAAGTFHFTVPYSQLKPYLTDRAKRCIGLI